MFCPRCGRENLADAAFCDGCGASLDAASTGASHPRGAAAAAGEVFVGRKRELATLAAAMEQTLAGQGRILVLAGEPGIGKTRTAQVLADHAQRNDVQVLWGRCHEEPGAPPYWPWLQAIRAWLDAADDEELQKAMANAGRYIAEIVPEILERLPELPPVPPATDAAHERFRLFDAFTGFWKRAAADSALLLILDNLHCADTSSLRLLEFLAHGIGASRLLILGTYRDAALSRQHPLSDILGELARHPWFQRLRLSGLSLEETGRFMAAAAGGVPPAELVAAVHNKTEGNPLFLTEMVRYLTQEGVLGTGGLPPAGGPGRGPGRIPEGVRDVIGARLNRLSLPCNRVLSNAAVIGRRFSLEVLGHLLDDLLDDQCMAALEEALGARVIDELPEPGSYQFSHVLIRDTLYEEMPTLRRMRLHQRIGAALEERYRSDLTPCLSELAHHYSAALPGGDAGKAVEYARRAADRANALLAYEDAARCYRLALQALELQMPADPAPRFKLQLALGDALLKASDYHQARDAFQQAAASARALGDGRELGLAAIGFEEATWRPGVPGHAAVRLLREALQALGAEDGVIEAQVLSCLSRALVFTGALDEAARVNERAVAMARRVGDPATLAAALRAGLAARWLPERLEARLAAAEEVIALAEQAGDKFQLLDARGWRMFDLLESADVKTAVECLEAQTALAEELRQPYFLYVSLAFRATVALFQGHFDASERLTGQAMALGRRMPGQDVSGVFGLQMFSLRREQGRLEELAPLLSGFVQITPKAMTWRPGLALVYAELDRKEEARAEFESLASEDFAAIPRDGMWPACIAFLAEVCALLGDAQRAGTLYRFLLPYDGHNVIAGAFAACYGAASRFLGMLARTMKRWQDAERHLEDAIAMNARQGARPGLAHSQYEYAAMLLVRGQPDPHERAAALLEGALTTSRALGMRALEERACALQRQLQSQPERACYPAGLTRREVEVLRLVAIGKGNREIAQRLFVSESTIANHLRGILAKTGSANRTEAAAFATRHKLLNDLS